MDIVDCGYAIMKDDQGKEKKTCFPIPGEKMSRNLIPYLAYLIGHHIFSIDNKPFEIMIEKNNGGKLIYQYNQENPNFGDFVNIIVVKLKINFCLYLKNVNLGIYLENEKIYLERLDNCYWSYQFDIRNYKFSLKPFLYNETTVIRQTKAKIFLLSEMVGEDGTIEGCKYKYQKNISLSLECEIK